MSQGKKHNIEISKEGSKWKADIIRRASAKKNVVSKTQDSFKTKKEASAWAEEQLALFLAQQSEQNKRRAEKRT
ncbi:MAG: pressure-regulated protein [Cycloclasticus sp. symbiont of Poecilosclerida sp. M]|nr:MAG: pressure-regulated protein [Cycloclasticus sp. symbiont of Poecilosclerida sp. M]